MNNYKDMKLYLGSTDIASLTVLTLTPGGNVLSFVIPFGEDGDIHAYLLSDSQEFSYEHENRKIMISTPKSDVIPDYYEKIFEGNTWLKTFDDSGFSFTFRADFIEIWRAGAKGMIIRLKSAENSLKRDKK